MTARIGFLACLIWTAVTLIVGDSSFFGWAMATFAWAKVWEMEES